MSSLREYFPRHVWVILFVLAGVAALAFFVPPSVTQSLGFSIIDHIIAISVIELGAAVGIGGLVVAYRPSDREHSEWRYDP